jgi:hypothetical protein
VATVATAATAERAAVEWWGRAEGTAAMKVAWVGRRDAKEAAAGEG